MYCKKCGKVLNQEQKFCTNCGTKIENEINSSVENNVYQQTNSFQQQDVNEQYVVSNNTKESKWKNTTSLVIGIISLILVFIFQILTIPLSIVGLVFGIISVKENKRNKVGLILNIISLGLAIPILLLYSNLLGISSNPTVGTWDCKAYNNGNYEDLEYIITMNLEKNNKFKWSKYNDEKNNYVIGEYEFTDLHKTNNTGTVNYYSIVLTGDEIVDNGVLQTDPYKLKYEMGLTKNSNEAVLINAETYNMYYCHKNSK